jgi:DNA repair protein RecN (Recombination protein N)
MIQSLYVKDFALFDELNLEFKKGLSVLIGESGSGKSLILDAISSLMGGRCSTSNIRQGKDRYILQAKFSIQNNSTTVQWLKENGISHSLKELTISKELSRDGKSRIFIGESLASLTLLRELGATLCDIHNQNEQLFLLDRSNQLEFLDRHARLEDLREEMGAAFSFYKSCKKKLTDLETRDELRKIRADQLKFQLQELDIIKPKVGELEELQKEENLLTNGEKLFENFKCISNLLYESEESVLQFFPSILQASEKISGIHNEFQPVHKEIKDVYEQLKSIKSSVREEEEEVFFSPDRLDGVQSRIKDLLRLKKKYNRSIEEVLDEIPIWKKELETIEKTEESIQSIRTDYGNSLNQIKNIALDLSKARRKGLGKFEEEIQKELEILGMKGSKIQIVLRWEEDPTGELRDGEKNYVLLYTGLDQAEYYFSANIGEKPRPLRKVASGGEISRIMLAIRSVMGKTHSSQKLLVFDEIDAGVSGDGAVSMADRLEKLSRDSQILVITHSQPIAAVAETHWKVEKYIQDDRTISNVKELNAKNKPLELAKMISGKEVTQSAVEHAKELLKRKAS